MFPWHSTNCDFRALSFLPLVLFSLGAVGWDSHDTNGDAITCIFNVIFLKKTVMNKFPHHHNWWEALTYPIIHQCTQTWCVCEKVTGLGVVGCWLRLLTVAPKAWACLGVCLCWGWAISPAAGESHSLGVIKPKWVTQWCALIAAARCPPCAERCSFVTERKKIHLRNIKTVFSSES